MRPSTTGTSIGSTFNQTLKASGYYTQQLESTFKLNNYAHHNLKGSPKAGSVDANLKAFAAAKNRANRSTKKPPNKKGVRNKNQWHRKPRFSQNLHVDSLKNSVPLRRSSCTPKMPISDRAFSPPKSPRSMVIRKHSRRNNIISSLTIGSRNDELEETMNHLDHYDTRE